MQSSNEFPALFIITAHYANFYSSFSINLILKQVQEYLFYLGQFFIFLFLTNELCNNQTARLPIEKGPWICATVRVL